MTYLVKYTDLTQDFPKPADINVIDRWEFVDKICEGSSLKDINKYLMKKELPIINSMENARLSGIMLVYSNSITEQLYVLDSEHEGCTQIMRDYKLKNIFNGK
jgi:hypothetical protein